MSDNAQGQSSPGANSRINCVWEVLLEEGTTATKGSIDTAGNRGDDGQFVTGGDGGGFLRGKVAKVFVIEINVDEGTELAFSVEKLLLQLRILAGEVGEDLGHGISDNSDRSSSAGERPKRGWDVNIHA